MGLREAQMALHVIAMVLLVPPYAWHIKTRNLAAISLLTFLFLTLLKGLVDAAVWGVDDYLTAWDGKVWCDIMIHIQMATIVGCVCAIFAIGLNLYLVLRADDWTVAWFAKRRRKTVIELAICFATPIFVVAVSYIYQPMRYSIGQYSGCLMPHENSYVFILLYFMWIELWCIASFVMACLNLVVFFQKRRFAMDILHCTNSGLSVRKFVRLLAFCFLIILVLFPLSIYRLYTTCKVTRPTFSWKAVHDKLMWPIIFRTPYDPREELDKWTYLCLAYLTFLLFGLGSDAVEMYKECLRKLGLIRVWSRLRKPKQPTTPDQFEISRFDSKETYRVTTASVDEFQKKMWDEDSMQTPSTAHFSHSDDGHDNRMIERMLAASELGDEGFVESTVNYSVDQ